jgi:Skp family chaperone for outer membrane proteins
MTLAPKFALASVLILGLTALTLGQAGGGAPAAPAAAVATNPPPTKLAVVNIVSLFADLLEKKAADAEIEKLKGEFETEGRKRQAELTDLEKPLAQLTPGSADYQKAQEDLLKKTMEMQSFNNYAQQRLFIELRVRTAALYRKINDSVAKYAAANGIALVFVADNSNMEKAATQEALMSMITTRKILYSHPDFDITSKIKQVMNTEFTLGGKTGG